MLGQSSVHFYTQLHLTLSMFLRSKPGQLALSALFSFFTFSWICVFSDDRYIHYLSTFSRLFLNLLYHSKALDLFIVSLPRALQGTAYVSFALSKINTKLILFFALNSNYFSTRDTNIDPLFMTRVSHN